MTVLVHFVLMLAASFDAWQLAFMGAIVGLLLLWSATWNRSMQYNPNEPPIIGTCLFTDGRARYVYEDSQAGQFIIGDNGERVFGVWLRPEEATDEPMIVETR